MVGMRQKLKDVELSPYMLAIYKDNEYQHLIKHALACWENRTKNGRTAPPGPLGNNPLSYCQFPPLDLIKEYRMSAESLISSRTLQCPDVARWALESLLDNEPEWIGVMLGQLYVTRVLMLINYDEELIYKIIYAGIANIMPAAFQFKLSEEQKLAATFCA